jgi:GNAT superfamily N-acetyltransferase
VEIQALEHADLPFIAAFQPPDWPDVLPSFRFYIDASFCHPIKAVDGNQIVGVGSSIIHDQVAWLATIITHPERRNRGIGTFVTSALVDSVKNTSCRTIMLVATPLGEPVYRKLGFETDGEYLFFRDGNTTDGKAISENVIPFDPKYAEQVYVLDRRAAGENREMRLNEFLVNAKLYVQSGRVQAFYLPSFGEGLIVAENPEAGLALLDVKHISPAATILPKENVAGIDYLRNMGYRQYRTAARMRLGKKLDWRPDMIYSRVSGAIG